MNDQEVHDRLGKVFNDLFGGSLSVDDPSVREKEHAWPSMKHIALIIALEQEFGLRLDGEAAAEMTTIAQVESHIKERTLGQ